MSAFLKAIEDNYLVFLIITIFLMLSLIGYYVDKKTRRDSDLKPMFSKIGKEKKTKDPASLVEEKKSKGLKLSFSKKDKKKEGLEKSASSQVASAPATTQVTSQSQSTAATPATTQVLPPASEQSETIDKL